ncbi:MAG: bifunctional folylpolyglutamate synthase/dihydrofolate synthase [Magnetovibrio sp.]|nr:bifunctional folylpolyglutamate synthase/dihydrofolate synthase [Magnetovibrio sp.]
MDLHPKLIDLSLGRVEGLLERLGNPERSLPPVVHVAGTNGKGSVIAMLRAMLEAAGRKVHVYTSPHLVRFHERIRVAGRLIDEPDLVRLLEECETANEGAPITFFEITTAAAYLAFARAPADVLLLETGLGGRLDATNVIRKPKVTVITPVSLDHQHFLGDSLREIAWEKAGIIKPGLPCVLAAQAPEADAAIRTRADELKSALYAEGADWSVEAADGGLVYSGATGRHALPLPNLAGRHQIANAGIALAALERLRTVKLGDPAAARGLTRVEWPGRMQRLTRGPLTAGLPDGWELWLDGGHNRAAGAMLAAHAAEHWRDRPLHLICGMLNSKDTAAFLKPLAAVAESLCAVTIPGEENAISGDALAATGGELGVPAAAADSVADGLADIAASAQAPARVLICGSLYLAGGVLAENG